MCGIAGTVSIDGSPLSEDDVIRLGAAAEIMRHRGPDGDGLWISQSRNVALAHRRLAIIDPTPEAAQPMIGEAGNAISFNGEIYNFNKLRSSYGLGTIIPRVPQSDTAVLLAHLESRGVSVLPEFRGFFTFAFWDEKSQELIIARDAIGKKPLYYGVFGNKFVFASELRALVGSGLAQATISKEAIASYLRYYSVPHPISIFEGINVLPPGSILRLSIGGIPIVERWYRLPRHEEKDITYDDAVAETRRILERSVRDRLVSDVPVGAFLSGGLDSNAIVGIAVRESKNRIETFSIGFKHTSLLNKIESETKWAAIGAKHYGTLHHERIVTGLDVVTLLPDFFQAMDLPTGDGLNSFLVSKAARDASPNLKVVLSGVGGDEAFLGYNKYRWLAQRASVLRTIWSMPESSRIKISEMLVSGHHTRFRAALRAAIMPESSRWLFSAKEISKLAGGSLPMLQKDNVESDTIFSLLRSDIEHYLPDMLLRDLDVFTMSQSFEARAPLLDKELMEFCWQLPLSIKSKGASKQLLADAVRDIIPEELLNKPKTGFELPMREWLLSGPLRPYLDMLVSDKMKLVTDGFLNEAAVRKVHVDFVKGSSHYLKPWSIVALEHWYRGILSFKISSNKLQDKFPPSK